jgi:hypothetical protein
MNFHDATVPLCEELFPYVDSSKWWRRFQTKIVVALPGTVESGQAVLSIDPGSANFSESRYLMLTRDEVIQLIFYLIVATALLLASRVRADACTLDEAGAKIPPMQISLEGAIVDPTRRPLDS